MINFLHCGEFLVEKRDSPRVVLDFLLAPKRWSVNKLSERIQKNHSSPSHSHWLIQKQPRLYDVVKQTEKE